jgi:hypothetical protein
MKVSNKQRFNGRIAMEIEAIQNSFHFATSQLFSFLRVLTRMGVLLRIAFLLALLMVVPKQSQGQTNPFELSVNPVTFSGLPALHSFSVAQFNGKWYVMGGRRDGLHRRQPFRAFDSAHANRYIWQIDPQQKTIDSLPIMGLPPMVESQLSSTNMLWAQEGDFLYLAGGYGLVSSNDVTQGMGDREVHRTFPYLTRVDLKALESWFDECKVNRSRKSKNASVNNSQRRKYNSTDKKWAKAKVKKVFSVIQDPKFALTGGGMVVADGKFYLAGGHRFDGLYNPMGPQNGPGFEQEYHRGIRVFSVVNSPRFAVQWLDELIDSTIRRRDLNVMEDLSWEVLDEANGSGQALDDLGGRSVSVFPRVLKSLQLFSGVFQERANIPHTTVLRLGALNKIQAVPAFHQLLNQYHSAHLAMYSYKVDAQFNVFFGGISQYFYNDSMELVQDPDVPVVQTASVVERNAAGEYKEYRLPISLPKGVGAGTEFIPSQYMPRMEGTQVVDMESLLGDSLLLGYLYGGFSTTAPNVFFDNDADESKAEPGLYAVYWYRNQNRKDPSSKIWCDDDWVVNQGSNGQLHFQAFANTETGKVVFAIEAQRAGDCKLILRDVGGKLLLEYDFPTGLVAGENLIALPLYNAKETKEYRVEIQSEGIVLKEILRINP